MTAVTLAKHIPGPNRRPMVNSWDVFDTLVARFFVNPIDAWRLVEQRTQDVGFLDRRLQAQKDLDQVAAPYSVHDIYRRMVSNGLDKQRAISLLGQELAVERELLFPIRAIVEMVEPGDLVISDMYLPDDFIFDLVRDLCGLDELRPIVKSNWGKATGTIWPEIAAHYAVRGHFGDNKHSDVELPRKFGIETSYVDNSTPTAWERAVADLGLSHLALVLRETRLRGVSNDGGSVQHTIAGPYLALLYGFCFWLAGSYGRDRPFVFLRRDADDLARIFSTLFPSIESTTADLSREIIASEHFDRALMSRIGSDAILVDLVTTGQTVSRFLRRNGAESVGIATLIHLDGLVQPTEAATIGAMAESGRLRCVARQSELANHHYLLECLLQTPWPPVTALSHDERSGGFVRGYGSVDLTPGERRIIKGKLKLVSEFTAALRRRGGGACDGRQAAALMRAALDAILAEKNMIGAFPSFLIRERGAC